MSKTVLSYGGTGVQGSPMAQAFTAQGFQVRTITRNPDSEAAQQLRQQGVDVRYGDMADVASLKDATQGVDIIALLVPFFVQPPNDHKTYMQNVLAAAVDGGVEKIVFNTSGPLPEARTGRGMIDYRHDLQDLLVASGIPYVTLVPGAYMENLMGPWTATAIREVGTLAYPLPNDKRLGWISTQDVAAFMVEAAKNPDITNTIIRISGPENLTGPEMAQRFSQALGRTINWRSLTPREFGDQIATVMGPQAGDALADDYGFINANMDTLMAYHDMSPVLERLPVSLTPLEDWVRRYAFVFNPS